MDGLYNNKLTDIIEIWHGRNVTIWYLGIIFVITGLIFKKIPLLKKKPVFKGLSSVLPFLGILCMLICFLTGTGFGFGIGNGTAWEQNENGNNDISIKEEPETLAEAAEQAVDKNTMNIVVTYDDVYVEGWKCNDSVEIKNAINSIYKDNMIIELEDRYAYIQPYEQVLAILNENKLYNFQETVYGGK